MWHLGPVRQVGVDEKHRTNAGCFWPTRDAGRTHIIQERELTLTTRSSRQFSVCSANNARTALQQVLGFPILVGRTRPEAKDVLTRVLEAHLAFPRGAQDTSPVGFVEHHDGTTTTMHRLVVTPPQRCTD